jgi:ABC-type Fe3+/spermidine/putrescine transport system ATPase subunit
VESTLSWGVHVHRGVQERNRNNTGGISSVPDADRKVEANETVAQQAQDGKSVSVRIDGISKQFRNGQLVLDEIDLEVQRGEVMFLLGSSGSGKSTLLRIISGLTEPSSGRIIIESEDVTDVSARKRGVGFVFQNFALFPHLTAKENIEFALRASGVPQHQWDDRVSRAMALGHIGGMESRYPRQLSGGQQQRLAVVRAVAAAPKVMLFDEPLSALDAVVRRRIRRELRELMYSLQVTSVFVSHDFMDVLDIGTRVAVLVNGKIEQVGTPQEVYAWPASISVASLTGRFNEFRGVVAEHQSNHVLQILGVGIGGSVDSADGDSSATGRDACVIVRPEDMIVAAQVSQLGGDEFGLPGDVVELRNASGVFECQVQLVDGTNVDARMWADGCSVQEGQRVYVSWRAGRGVLVDG